MTPSTPPFTRDRLTWLCYGLLAYYAYLQASLGPVMPFLRDEMALSYLLGGLHSSAFAIGMIGAGLLGERVARRWGRRVALWGGGAGMAGGALLFVAGRGVLVTLPAVFGMGLAGSLLLITLQAVLADHHGRDSATALTEANVAASMSATLAPLAVGSLAGWGVGWRVGLLLALAFLVLLGWRAGRTPLPRQARDEAERGGTGSLPRRFWAFWLVLVLVVAAEWCVVLWSADYLETIVGFGRSDAARWMSVFFFAAVVGRLVGSRLTRSLASEPLLLLTMLVALGGLLLFLQPSLQQPFLNVAGLFVAGLGVANLFPLTLSVAVGLAPHQSDEASARVALGAGLAILLAPLLLGSVADQVGLTAAFSGIVLPMLGAASLLLLVNSWQWFQRSIKPAPQEGEP